MKTDVIWRTLELAMQSCPSLSQESARAIEAAARSEFAGTRVWIAEQPFHPERAAGRKSVPREVANALYQDALTNTPTAELVKRHGLSRATIYRLMKRGPSD
jgi:hypothetical protein